MYLTVDGLRRLKATESVIFFAISILLNAAANALTVSTNLGSAIWTASAVNLSNLLNIKLGAILAIYGILVIFINISILRKITVRRVLGNLLFIFPFSYLVQFFTEIFNSTGIPDASLTIRLMLDLLGVILIGVAVSIYQRVKLVLHPNDDLSYILRFNFFNGNAAVAQYVSYILPISITVICLLISRNIFAVNIGTLISLVIQGPVTGWADQHVFLKLKHRFTK